MLMFYTLFPQGGIFISLHFTHNGMILFFQFYMLPLGSDMSLHSVCFVLFFD